MRGQLICTVCPNTCRIRTESGPATCKAAPYTTAAAARRVADPCRSAARRVDAALIRAEAAEILTLPRPCGAAPIPIASHLAASLHLARIVPASSLSVTAAGPVQLRKNGGDGQLASEETMMSSGRSINSVTCRHSSPIRRALGALGTRID